MAATDAEIRRIRRLIGDTVNTSASPYLLSEFDLLDIYEDTGSVYGAAVEAAQALAAHFAGHVDHRIDEHYQSSDSDKFTHYTKLAETLRLQASRNAAFSGAPIAGGIRKSAKQTVEEDTNRVQPAFTRKTHDYRELSDLYGEQE